jgi:hypothetical protein
MLPVHRWKPAEPIKPVMTADLGISCQASDSSSSVRDVDYVLRMLAKCLSTRSVRLAH